MKKRITVEELARAIHEGNQPILMDLLPGEVFEKRRLPGAVSACVFEVTFPQQVEAVTRDFEAAIVVYGHDGNTGDAEAAVDKLERLGYRNISVLEGGCESWREAGYEMHGADTGGYEVLDRWLDLSDRTYRVDRENSLIYWLGRNSKNRHYGTVNLAGGDLTVRDGMFTGRFEVDMSSIKNIDLEGDENQPVLLNHLKSDDFFFVSRFPKAVFEIESANFIQPPEKTSPNFMVNGRLNLRGIKAPFNFPATANPGPDGGILVEADFNLDRTAWGAIYGSSRFFRFLSYHLVFDFISIEIRLALV